MEPRLVAILDRYILDVANTKYALSLLPPDGLGHVVPGSSQTVAEVVDHAVAAMAEFAGGAPDSADNAAERLDRVLAGLIEHCRNNEAAIDLNKLEAGSRHLAMHGLDIIAVTPEIQFDPLMLNWLLYADYTGAPARAEQQRALLRALRERYPDPEGDDDAS